jgi:multiple antibiotic resistance protein
MEAEFIKTAFATLFVAVDPPGLAAIFLGLTSSFTAAQRKTVAYQSVIIATTILIVVMMGGEVVLTALGITMPAFRIAGGILLFYIAVEMVFEKREQRKSNSADSAIEQDHPKNIAAFPLAMPLMAGPGAITATIVQAGHAHGILAWAALGGGSCLAVFLMAGHIDRLLGTTGRVVLSRILGLLLAALAIQIVGDGAIDFFK